MSVKILPKDDRLWLFSGLVGFGILHLNLTWKTTENLDLLTTNSVFWGAILWLLWQKRDRLSYRSDPISSFLGLGAIALILVKLLSLFWFESVLISLTPVFFAIGLALIASGFRGLFQYGKELFFAWFLFFPTEALGLFIDNLVSISTLTAKFSTYGLYYVGFNVATQGKKVFLSVPDVGNFQAFVKYGCTGIPMMLLMLKLALLLVSVFSFTKNKCILIPTVSVVMGFILGVIRVCILTLTIPYPARFDYWHGDSGSQIFSTLAICIFAGYCYWILRQQEAIKQNSKSQSQKNSVNSLCSNNMNQ